MGDPLTCFETGTASDVGLVRTLNEDALVALPERGLWCVADGMGGHDDGQVASAAVADALSEIPPGRDLDEQLSVCAAQIGEANRRVFAIARSRGATIGTTVAILLARGREFACVWAGDSRIYQIRDGRIRQITRDHTEAQDLLDQGLLTAHEARTWPRRNVITRAVGVAPEAELELRRGDLLAGDAFVLCTDGLTGHVGDEEILTATLAHSPGEAARALVALTLERGARDNVTVIVLRGARRLAAPQTQAAAREATSPPAGELAGPARAGDEGLWS